MKYQYDNIDAIVDLEALFESPYQVDMASVPKAGIASAPEQVAGTWSVAYLKYERLRKILVESQEEQKKLKQARKEIANLLRENAVSQFLERRKR